MTCEHFRVHFLTFHATVFNPLQRYQHGRFPSIKMYNLNDTPFRYGGVSIKLLKAWKDIIDIEKYVVSK